MTDDGRGGWFRVPNAIFNLEADIDAESLLILLALYRWADHKNICYPSQQVIAEKTRLSKRTVMRKLEILVSKGLIKRVKPEGRRHYFYKICLPIGDTESPI